MERSRNWHDLRSSIYKFRDKHFVSSYVLTTSCEFQINRLKTLTLALLQTFLEVGSLDLVWWPDLRWPEVIFFSQSVRNWCTNSCAKTRRRCAPPFSLHLRKCHGGGGFPPPPPEISKTTLRSDKRKTAFDSLTQVLAKVFQSFFRSGQNWGHERSPKAKFSRFFMFYDTAQQIPI